MEYKYITEDNLEHRQDYMYAPYGGQDFLDAYYRTREPFLVKCSTGNLIELLQLALQEWNSGQTAAATQLRELLQSFDRVQIDVFVKRFEVSKRLYAEYSRETGKAIVSSGFHDIRAYMILAVLTERAYSEFGSLKYLNCLLKLDDTLLSLAPEMDERLLEPFKIIVSREVGHVMELARRKDIVLKGG